MIEENEVAKDSNWRRFFRKHWGILALFVVAAILAVAGAVYVFVWFTGNAQSIGLVPSTLGAWSMNNLAFESSAIVQETRSNCHGTLQQQNYGEVKWRK